MTEYLRVCEKLAANPRRWLVTGAAGFIGSHLAEALLKLGQQVVGLDNFATGFRGNVESLAKRAQGDSFRFVEADIRDAKACSEAVKECDYVLHQAALGSVPRSFQDPVTSNAVNIDGFLNVLAAAAKCGLRRLVYASSSSVYGDSEALPKVEGILGEPLSPYAVTKRVNELYAGVFAKSGQIEPVGLRYFNVFGPRQDPNGAYAAVIPRWISRLKAGENCIIYGDGATSRDFCYVENVVQANILAAATEERRAIGAVFNVGVGRRTTLNELYQSIAGEVYRLRGISGALPQPVYQDFRPGDVRHSLADISEIRSLLGFEPSHEIARGMRLTVESFFSS